MACETLYPICPPSGDLHQPPGDYTDTFTTAVTGGDITFALVVIAVAVVLGVAALLIARRRTRVV